MLKDLDLFVDAVVGGVTGDLRDDGVGEVGGEVIEVRRGSENLSPKNNSNLEFTNPPMSRSAGVAKGGITSPGLERRLKLS